MTQFAYAMDDIAAKQADREVRLPPEAISVLTQVREVITITEDLLPSTLSKGQIAPGTCAALTPHQARRYVLQLNDIFRATHTMQDLTKVFLDGKQYYLVLVFGHRRHATVLHINNLVSLGTASPTDQYDGLFWVRLRFGLTAEEAIELQFNENRHTVPPPHVEAKKAWGYYRYLQRGNPAMTHGEFARRIGRTTDWMRNTMRFCSLPQKIQGFVDGDNKYGAKLPYGVLLHLARLAEGMQEIGLELPEEGQEYWLITAFTEQLDTVAFGKKVSNYLEDKRREQRGQLSLFDPSQTPSDQQRHLRGVVSRNLTQMMWVQNSWIDDVNRLVQGGAFGEHNPLDLLSGENPLSPGSPARVLAARLRQFEILLPIFASLARRDGLGSADELEAGIPLVAAMSAALEDILGRQSVARQEHASAPQLMLVSAE